MLGTTERPAQLYLDDVEERGEVHAEELGVPGSRLRRRCRLLQAALVVRDPLEHPLEDGGAHVYQRNDNVGRNDARVTQTCGGVFPRMQK